MDRNVSRSLRIALTVASALFGAGTALAQAPAGPEFQVNTTAGTRFSPAVAMDASGSFVVAWTAYRSNPFSRSVRARQFDARGIPRGGEIVVVNTTEGGALEARVGSDSVGNFVVAWRFGTTVDEGDIFAQRFSAAGAPLTPPFQVNTYTTRTQYSLDLAMSGSGEFVVAWTNDAPPGPRRVKARRYSAAGSPRGEEFEVEPETTGFSQHVAAVGMGSAGGFIVAWEHNIHTIRARRFTAAGSPVGSAFDVPSVDPGWAVQPALAVQPSGAFVVAWNEIMGVPDEVRARRFDAAGTPLGSQFLVHALSDTGLTSRLSVAGLPNDGFVIAWYRLGADSSYTGVEARRFTAAGQPVGRTFLVNSTEPDYQWDAALAANAAGNLAGVWHSSAGNGVTFGVFGQRFGFMRAVGLAVDTSASGQSDGNGVLEPSESVDLRPSWQNNTGAPRAFASTLASLLGPPGAAYTIGDGTGFYGTIPDGAIQDCIDCYRVSVSATPRPVLHWDAIASELLEDGSEAQTRWPVHVGDSFADVPRASGFYRFVETLLHVGVTGGCDPIAFCPGQPVTREQMAPFVLTSKEERGYRPLVCGPTPLFADVPSLSVFCRWIEELARRGVVSGCAPGLYCPSAPVTREQMAVFVLRTLDPTLNPPACVAGAEVFADVPASSPFCRWIEELARRGVVTGCGGGNYCPGQPVTREQMSVFLTVTFGLTLYGP